MDIQKWLNDQNIEAVQDRKDGKDYWMYDNLYTEIDLIELLEAFSLHVVSQRSELLMATLTSRVLTIQSEPDGVVRETMINNLLVDINCA
jgi:hypothetical protein